MITSDGKLEVFENFIVDRSLPKHKKPEAGGELLGDSVSMNGGKAAQWGCYNLVERVPKENSVACVEWLLTCFRSCRSSV